MNVDVKSTGLGRLRDEACVMFVRRADEAKRAARSMGKGAVASMRTLLGRKAFTGASGELATITQGADDRVQSVIVVGVGETPSLESLRQAAGTGLRAARSAGASSVSVAVPEWSGKGAAKAARLAEFIVEGSLTSMYRFDAYQGDKSKQNVEALTFVGSAAHERRLRRAVEAGQALSAGVCVARDLGNEPPNTATPVYLASEAAALAAKYDNLSVRIFDEDEMSEMGMGSLLSVGQGSANPSRLIMLTYNPPSSVKRPKTVAIVGKGITFDTGGISIKPSAKLEDMKFDMCGAAAVMGAMRSVAELKPKVRVVGMVAAAENMPSSKAYRPGDILTAMNGKTIEVKNTDAEGRLVLADALTYAATKLRPKPKAIIDLATLTGACIVALGNHHGAVIGNDDTVVEKLLDAAEESGDALWRLPLTDDYRAQLKSAYADVTNLGSPGAGTITAAAFLENFTGGVPWAHLDIAGMAWTQKTGGTFTTGATGFGVRVLARLLRDW